MFHILDNFPDFGWLKDGIVGVLLNFWTENCVMLELTIYPFLFLGLYRAKGASEHEYIQIPFLKTLQTKAS